MVEFRLSRRPGLVSSRKNSPAERAVRNTNDGLPDSFSESFEVMIFLEIRLSRRTLHHETPLPGTTAKEVFRTAHGEPAIRKCAAFVFHFAHGLQPHSLRGITFSYAIISAALPISDFGTAPHWISSHFVHSGGGMHSGHRATAIKEYNSFANSSEASAIFSIRIIWLPA